MENTYSFLALTDHRNHSDQNSIYALLSELSSHPRCEKVAVATRGFEVNDPFFYKTESESLYVTDVTSTFYYDKDGGTFKNNMYTASIYEFDVVLLRLPRPVEDSFLKWLRHIDPDKVIINDPEGIIITSNKSFLLNFPDLCPPIQLVDSVSDILELAGKYPVVLKPLKEYGGKGLIRIKDGIVNDGSLNYPVVEFFNKYSETFNGTEHLAMQYLENVKQGDKRIIVVNGEIMGASLRLPADGAWLCNVAQGGSSIPAQPDSEEVRIVERINPLLKKHGILIYGVDTLVDNMGKRVLSEINTLSIGGFPQAQKQSGRPIIKLTMNNLIKYLDEQLQQSDYTY